MKLSPKSIKATAYVSGIFAIAAAGLLAVLLVLSLLGLIHPRAAAITLFTEDVQKMYDGAPLVGSLPRLSSGTLHGGHYITVRKLPQLTQKGEIPNTPDYQILDETGADVTEQYDIHENFGTLTVQPRPITLSTRPKTKRYDGEPLLADKPTLSSGTLVAGHYLEYATDNGLTLPDTIENRQDFTIFSSSNEDVTDQYAITESYGALKVLPLQLYIRTDSASKIYDGKALQAEGWEFITGKLLDGHSLSAQTVTVLDSIGKCDNELSALVTDANGTDVSYYYDFYISPGTLEILPLPLHITTGSATKIYDGTPLSCESWSLTGGTLESGATLVASDYYSHTTMGSVQNSITFRVLDAQGKDISQRYDIQFSYGTLDITPRHLTIRTDSAEKKYDGTPLFCDTYQIISGSLCPNDQVALTCTNILDVGYSENYVLDCTVLNKQGNTLIDVTGCYQITFQHGTLRIT